MQIVYALISFVVGFLTLFITYKDEKRCKPNWSVSYTMHLKGYVGGIAFVLIGLMLVLEYLK